MVRRLAPFVVISVLAVGLAVVAEAGDWGPWAIVVVGLVLTTAVVTATVLLTLRARDQATKRFDREMEVITGTVVTGIETARNCGNVEPLVHRS